MLSLNIKIEKNNTITIQQQLIDAIIHKISINSLSQGDILPSVNQLSKTLSISRDTVFKAYQELKRRGLTDSTPSKNYYVAKPINRILLVLDYFSMFKDNFQQSFTGNLPGDYYVDIVYHHYNEELFESILLNSIGKYSAYAIMNPDTKDFIAHNILNKLDSSKVLFIDIPIENWNNLEKHKYSFICQNFNEAVYSCLSQIEDVLRKYQAFHIVYTEKLKHPPVTISSFENFCKEKNIEYSVQRNNKNISFQQNHAYFILVQDDLAKILESCKENHWIPGKDIGILVYNDSPLYEFVSNGISSISTDFNQMGKQSADFIKHKTPIKNFIPTKTILRQSI